MIDQSTTHCRSVADAPKRNFGDAAMMERVALAPKGPFIALPKSSSLPAESLGCTPLKCWMALWLLAPLGNAVRNLLEADRVSDELRSERGAGTDGR